MTEIILGNRLFKLKKYLQSNKINIQTGTRLFFSYEKNKCFLSILSGTVFRGVLLFFSFLLLAACSGIQPPED